MKILAIRGENLASLGRTFAVDLAGPELGGAGIFAICGPVGAGKTTLLDALCLALFDRTPRLSGARGGVPIAEPGRPEAEWLPSQDPRTLLRRGAAAGRAEVDFTGRDGRRYRATWTVRRARQRVDGRLQTQEMALADLDRGIVVAAATKSEVLLAIRQRLGLDFDQFCRSVLLAQGEFSAFLRASADERANLLESLTGVEVYRQLSKAAHARRRDREAAVERLRAQAEAHVPLVPERREQLVAAVAALGKEVQTSQLGVQLAQNVVSWYAAAGKLRSAEEDAMAKLVAARDAMAAAAERRQQHAALVRALPVVARAEVVRERQQEVVNAVAARVAATEAATAAQRELETLGAALRADLARTLPTAGDPPRLVTEHERWRPVLQRWRAACARLAAQPAAERLRAVIAAADEALAARAADLRAVQQALAAPEFADLAARRRAQLAAATELRARRQAVAAWQAAAAEAARAGAEHARLERERDELAAGFDLLVAARETAAAGLAAARARHDHARARADLAAFRAHLAAGEPCPLCGSAEHPQPAEASPSELAAAAAAVAESERELDAAHDAVRTREAQRRANAQQLAAAGIAAAKAAQHEVVRRQAAGARLGAEAASSPELAARELAAAEADHAATEAALAADGERAEQLSEQREALRAAERDAARGRAEAEQQLRERQDAEAAVRVHATALEPAFEGVADWPRRVADLGAEPLAALAAVEARRAAAAARHPELAAAAERAFGAEVSAIASHAAAVQVAEQAMAAARVRATDVAEAARLGADAIECEGIELRELEVAVERARAALQECARLRREHEAVARPMIEEEDAKGALADARAASDEFGRRLADARANLTLDDRVRLARAEIAPRLLRAEADYAIWAALDDLIGHSDGKTFAVFAQALTLDLLLVEANRRLQELAPRYRLQRNGGRDMDFAVLDLDLGGAVRSLQTLSGGETFLVSLALALALATLAAPRTRVETLFLDEGFGTLDAHNLEIALGALDSLQAAGCQIGIISHVDGIAERIGATVHVVPEGAGRSRVEVRTG